MVQKILDFVYAEVLRRIRGVSASRDFEFLACAMEKFWYTERMAADQPASVNELLTALDDLFACVDTESAKRYEKFLGKFNRPFKAFRKELDEYWATL